MTEHPKNRERRGTSRVWVMLCIFILTLVGLSALDLRFAYSSAIQTAYDKADLSSHLVSEWISESLYNIKYILRDTSLQVEESPELRALKPTSFSDPFNQLLLQKSQADSHLLILGVNDATGLLAYSSIPELLGKSAKDLEREYLDKARQEPLDAFKIGNAFTSSTGILNVTATYPVFSPSEEFIGFSMAGIDLSFFQRWLDRIEDPSVTITIIDSKQKILARKPLLNAVGKTVQIAPVREFIADEGHKANFRLVSVLDQADRLWSIRRIDDLPFLVAVGYSTEQALAGWINKLVLYAAGILIVTIVSVKFVRKYILSEHLVKELQDALSKVKVLSGFIPICAKCKNIRDDKGYWNRIETYIREHSDADFSHGICPDCAKELYPEFSKDAEPAQSASE